MAELARVLLLTGTVLVLVGCETTQRDTPNQIGGATAFDRADTNHDEVVDLEEWDQYSARLFDEIDKDGDGQASSEELARSFDSFDFNDDGVIDGREAPLVVALGDTDGDRLIGPEEFKSIDWTRETIDTDRDETVSWREFRAARREIFDPADRDRDRRLRRNELDEAATFTIFRF